MTSEQLNELANCEDFGSKYPNILDLEPPIWNDYSPNISSKIDFEYDMEELIELSKQMQCEFIQSIPVIPGAPVLSRTFPTATRSRPTRFEEGGQRSVSASNHRRFLVPPLFLNDDYILREYTKDLVNECFKQTNNRFDMKLNDTNTNTALDSNAPIPELKSPHREPSSKTLPINSETTIHARPTIRPTRDTTHSCVDGYVVPASSRKKRTQFCGKSQSARAAYSARYYDFKQTHPNLELVESGTLFPCRVSKEDATLKTKQCEIEQIDLVGIEDNDPDEQSPTDTKPEHEEFNEHSAHLSDREKSTWHDVFSTNTNKITQTNCAKEVVERLTQTSPQLIQDAAKPDFVETEYLIDSISPMGGCAIQTLPPLNIKGTCRIQHLPHFSIDAATNSDTNAKLAKPPNNNIFVNMIYSPDMPTDKMIPDPLPAAASTISREATIGGKFNLKPSSTSTDSFGGISNTKTSNDSPVDSSTTTDFNVDDTSSALNATPTEDENSFLKTDDEKLKVKRFRLRKRQVSRPRSTDSENHPINKPMFVTHEKSIKRTHLTKTPVYSESVMKIIEEIFESSTEDLLKSRKPASSKKASETHKCLSRQKIEIPAIENSFVHTERMKSQNPQMDGKTPILELLNESIVSSDPTLITTEKSLQKSHPPQNQHDNKTGVNNNELSNCNPMKYKTSTRSSISTKTTQLNDKFDDIPDATTEMIKTSNKIYKLIRTRKEPLYQHDKMPVMEEDYRGPDYHQVNVPTPDTISSKPTSKSSIKPTGCSYRRHIEIELKKSQIEPPGNFNCAQPSTATIPIKHESPSVRLENLRRVKHQQLVEKHPDIERTLSSIQREVEQGTRAHDVTNSFRSKYKEDDVLSAAQKFLASLMKPTVNAYTSDNNLTTNSFGMPLGMFPSQYLDDSVQLEAEQYLKTVNNLNESVSHQTIGSKLFRTESSMEYRSSDDMRSSYAPTNYLLHCTNSENNVSTITQSDSSNEALSVIASTQMKDGNYSSSLKSTDLSGHLKTISTKIDNTDNSDCHAKTSSHSVLATEHVANECTTVEQSTSSSIQKQILCIIDRLEYENSLSQFSTSDKLDLDNT